MRMQYTDAINYYGSDKPDLRFDMKINDISEIFKNTEFTVFKTVLEENGIINAIVVKNAADKYSRKDLDKLTDYVKTNDMNNELSLKVDVTELELYALKADVNNVLNNKVNKETGKSLVSDGEIAKIHEHNNKDVLDRITQDKINAWELAEENVQSDWTNNDIGSDAYILNKPDLSIYAEKDNATFTSSISLGRKAGTLINVNSFAVGNDVTAKGENSHAEGSNTVAGGTNSHAEGSLTITADNATASHAEGLGTQATAIGQHVEGRYNEANINYAHIVGNGTSDTDRSNAHVLDWDGNAWYKGVVRIDGIPTNDNDLVTKKYVDDLVSSLMTTMNSLSVGSLNLPVGISGVSVGSPNVWYGTHEEYEALVEKDENITYIIKGNGNK
jgi:Glu-tRNA(Gln) amidotransferase subunit E-like FAD-binding protein